MNLKIDPASYRDPRGHVMVGDDVVYRSVLPPAVHDVQFVRRTGLIQELSERGWLLAEKEVPVSVIASVEPNARLALQHPKLDVLTYPYEWSFSALKDAALHHLSVQLMALEKNVSLVDASAYNVQFQGTHPIFIDHLAFKAYQSGEFWLGNRQFCEQFLYPLLMQAYCGLPFQPLYRGNVFGISAEELRAVLPGWRKWCPNILKEVVLPLLLARAVSQSKNLARTVAYPKRAYERHLLHLQKWIANLRPQFFANPTWKNYEQCHSYQQQAHDAKQAIVKKFIAQVKPKLLFDLGCNTGEYAEIALHAGAKRVIGIERDAAAVDLAYQRAKMARLNFLPLCMDVLNVSPAQGFRLQERRSLVERLGHVDGLLALALVHHLVLQSSVQMAQLIPWLVSLAPQGLIEFAHPDDDEVALMLARNPIYQQEYQLANFLTLLRDSAAVVQQFDLPAMKRTVVWYVR
jgi:ribosomal protein L11 methylase PrmA